MGNKRFQFTVTMNWNCFRAGTGETNEVWKAREKGGGGQRETML